MALMTRLLVLLVLAAIAVAQTTWTVDRFNRPGAQFNDLPAAVAASVSGDVILLRATTTSLADSYLAPTIRGKGVTIIGETGPGLPRVNVTGAWTIDGVPPGANTIISNLHMQGAYQGTGPGGSTRIFMLSVTNCVGSVGFVKLDTMLFGVFLPPVLRDNALLLFSECSFDMTDGTLLFERCKVMMNNVQVMRNNAGTGSNGSSIMLRDSDLHVAGCDLRGANGNALNPASSSVVEFATSSATGNLFINATSRLEAGVNTFGSRENAVRMSATPTVCQQHRVYRDFGATIIEGFGSGCAPTTIQPVSGLRTSTSQNVLQIHHDTTPNAPAILLMAPLQPAPWNGIIGPCFLDQNFVWSSLDIAPASGPLTRTFTIPPTIPIGQWVGVQAFEYEILRNRVIGTNVTVVGVL